MKRMWTKTRLLKPLYGLAEGTPVLVAKHNWKASGSKLENVILFNPKIPEFPGAFLVTTSAEKFLGINKSTEWKESDIADSSWEPKENLLKAAWKKGKNPVAEYSRQNSR